MSQSRNQSSGEFAALERFAGVIKYPTVSTHPEPFTLQPFHEMREYARLTWPRTFSTLGMELHGEASILLVWEGSYPSARPFMLAAHQDVVPAGEEEWTFDPFGGEISGGRVHGRGTIDYKCGFAGMLEACEMLIQDGFSPERTVLLAFGHDEEIGGLNGAGSITDSLLARSIHPSSVLDEGGYIFASSSDEETAQIALAEKGYATFRLVADSVQCHSSVPSERTAIGMLARAVMEVEKLQMNCSSTGTTFAPTVISGGCRENVLPGRAEALINTRPAPSSSVALVGKQLIDAVGPLGIRVELVDNASVSEPSMVSGTDTADYMSLRSSISAVLGESFPVSSGVFPAATDSRRYGDAAENVYRFLPVHPGIRGIGALHSVDESILTGDYLNCTYFYREYIRHASIK